MGSGTGTHSGSGSSSSSSSPPPINSELKNVEEEEEEEEEEKSDQVPPSSLPSTVPSHQHSPPVGLLNHRNLVQDEKLVVATLASLNNSGDPSNIIKQDLRLIIQSRRKAEGKGELQVDFTAPPKDELTEEEWQRAWKRRDQNRRAARRFRQKQRNISSGLSEQQLTGEELEKRARRRELNRLAAKRSREKCQRRRDILVQEIQRLQTRNGALEGDRGTLTEERDNLVHSLKGHLPRCLNSTAMTRSMQLLSFSRRLAQLLDWTPPAQSRVPERTALAPLSPGDQDVHPQGPPPAQPSLLHHPYVSAATSPVSTAFSQSGESAPCIIREHSNVSGMTTRSRGHRSREQVLPSKELEIDVAAAATLREEIERRHHRLQFRVSAPPSPTLRSPYASSVRTGSSRNLPFSPHSASPPHPVSQPATPTCSLASPKSLSPHLLSPLPLSSPTPFSTHVSYPFSPPLLSAQIRPSHGFQDKGVVVKPGSESKSLLSLEFSRGQPISSVSLQEKESVEEQGVVRRPQSLDLRGPGMIPKKDPSLRSPVIPKKDSTLLSPVTVSEPPQRSLTIPKKDPALRSAIIPKKDPALRSPMTIPKKDPALRSPVLPKKDPALRSLVVDTPSPPTLPSSSAHRASGLFKRGPVLRVASFHGMSSPPPEEQLIPLNLSKRRKSEDLSPAFGEAEEFSPFSGGSSSQDLGRLHTWPPPGGSSWTKRDEEASRPLNLVLTGRQKQPSATITSAEALQDPGEKATHMDTRENLSQNPPTDYDNM